jgi:hypothetical protein
MAFDDLDAATVAEWNSAVEIKEMPQYWGGHVPSAHQQAFLWLPQMEAMYGGAAGGGKSDALLMASTQYVDVSGYAALLLRRSYSDLDKANALIPRSRLWLAGTDAKWNENKHKWTFPTGATLEFGFVRHVNDLMQYQSAEYQFIGIDELTQWPKFFYTFLFSRLRKVEEHGDLPLRMRSATNPGGPGHEWVKQRFVEQSETLDNGDPNPEYDEDRIFIPAKLDDNVHINRESYLHSLSFLDPELQQQLLDGSWDAREPGNWVLGDPTWVDAAVEMCEELLTDPITGLPCDPPEPDRTPGMDEYNFGRPVIHLGIDWGEHTQGYVIWPLERGGIYVPSSEVVSKHEDPQTSTVRLLNSALAQPYPLGCSRYDAAGVQSMRTFVATAKNTYGIRTPRVTKVAFSKYKKETMGYLRQLFKRTAEGHTTRVIAIHPDNKELIRQLKRWERKDEESDETTKVDDHGPDALVAGAAPIMARYRQAYEDAVDAAYRTKEKA